MNYNKHIKDYLHLYLGCALDPGNIVLTPERLKEILDDERDNQLILRPISDLKEDEAIELGKRLLLVPQGRISAFKNRWNKWVVKWSDNYRDHWLVDGEIFNQHQTIYLLKQCFDVFGLIELGVAIDQTKFTSHEQNKN